MDRRATNGCAENITTSTNAGRLIVDGLCLTSIILIVWLWQREKKRTPSVTQLLPWYSFGVLLVLSAFYLAFGVIITILGSCSSVGPLAISGMSVPAYIASGSANILLLGILALPILEQLLHSSISKRKRISFVFMIMLALLVCAFIASAIVSNLGSISRFSRGFDNTTRELLIDIGTKVSVAYFSLYFILSIIVALIMGYASWKAVPSILVRQKKQRIWVSITIASLLVGSGSAVAQMYAFTLPGIPLSPAAWILFLAIFNVAFVSTIFAVLQTAKTIVFSVVDPTNSATYDPDASEEMQPAIHKRFTYTRSTEIERPENVYTTDDSGWPLTATTTSPNLPVTSPTRSIFGLRQQTPRVPQHAF